MTAKTYSNWFAREIDKKGSAVVVVQCFNEHLACFMHERC